MTIVVRTSDVFDDRHSSREQRLWICVLRVMVWDALGKNLSGLSAAARDDAIKRARVWLCFGSDLHVVAMFAGFDGDRVRAWALDQRERGWPDAQGHPMKEAA